MLQMALPYKHDNYKRNENQSMHENETSISENVDLFVDTALATNNHTQSQENRLSGRLNEGSNNTKEQIKTDSIIHEASDNSSKSAMKNDTDTNGQCSADVVQAGSAVQRHFILLFLHVLPRWSHVICFHSWHNSGIMAFRVAVDSGEMEAEDDD
ncbi:PREDICTED: uncharacterized protein LOC100636415 [Amphimedon queenslandica]|uniref:Uncharacterized protein n=1 Tax=Amphimedon queenslandica TaxID=400682 RepID=A0AAN0JAE6_AMPQE|nr:PREDICTED: uncharacterized protein LOC100636415 [Amphimedon queenslandica]|eukprot:XP_019854030.1 PREDICTED: uncharacterized protein LOC100636415 [Amphimedon queenslandica]